MIKECTNVSKMMLLSQQYQLLASSRLDAAQRLGYSGQNEPHLGYEARSKSKESMEPFEDIKRKTAQKGNDLREEARQLTEKATEKGRELKQKAREVSPQAMKDKILEKGQEMKDAALGAKSKALEMGQEVKDQAIGKGLEVKEKALDVGQEMTQRVNEKGKELKEMAAERGQDLKRNIESAYEKSKDQAQEKMEKTKKGLENIEEKAADTKEKLQKTMDTYRRKDDGKMNEPMRERDVAEDMQDAKERLAHKGVEVKEGVKETARKAKDSVLQKAWEIEEEAKQKVVGAVEGVKDSARHAKDAVLHTTRTVEEEAKDKVKETARNVADTAVEKTRDLKESAENRWKYLKNVAEEKVADVKGKEMGKEKQMERDQRAKDTLENSNLADSAHAFATAAVETGREMKDAFMHNADELKETAGKVAGVLRDKARGATTAATETVQQLMGESSKSVSLSEEELQRARVSPFLDPSYSTGKSIGERLSFYEEMERKDSRVNPKDVDRKFLQNKIREVENVLKEEGATSASKYAPCLQAVSNQSLDEQGRSLRSASITLYGAESCWFNYIQQLEQCKNESKDTGSCFMNARITEFACLSQSKKGLKNLKDVLDKAD